MATSKKIKVASPALSYAQLVMSIQNMDPRPKIMKSEAQEFSKNFPSDSDVQTGLSSTSLVLPPCTLPPLTLLYSPPHCVHLS